MNPSLAVFLTIFSTAALTLAPMASPAAYAQTLRDAGKAAMDPQSQPRSCEARAEDWLEACEAAEAEDDRTARGGLGWTGIGLSAAGASVLVQGLTVSRWRNCGPGNKNHCQNLERTYRTAGGTMLATGLTFLVFDEMRRVRERERLAPRRQIALAIAPRAIQLRMQF